MDKLRIGGNWSVIKVKLQQLYRSLTDDDLLYEEGKELELVLRLQRVLRRKRADIVSIINYIADSSVSSGGNEFDTPAGSFDYVSIQRLDENP